MVTKHPGLDEFKQFVIWKEVPNKDGKKPDKIPIDYQTGNPGNIKDAATWLSRDDANEIAARLGMHVGFVFTADLGLTFIDLDHCYDPTTNTITDANSRDLAEAAFAAGALVEISHSGTGLHIICAGKLDPRSRNKSRDGSIEVYDNERFMALGSPFMNEKANASVQAQPIIDTAQRMVGLRERDIDDPNAPFQTRDPECTTPVDDDEALAYIREKASKSGVLNKLGIGADFNKVFDGDPEELAKHFRPHPTDKKRTFDWSDADNWLLTELSYWCGRDAAQVDRLFRRSALYRPKWDVANYRNRSLRRATARENVNKMRTPQTAANTMPAGTANAADFMEFSDIPTHFNGHTYVHSVSRVFVANTGQFYTREGYENAFNRHTFMITDAVSDTPRNRLTTESAWKAFVQSRISFWPEHARHVDEGVYDPRLPLGERGVNGSGRTFVNVYDPRREGAVAVGDPGPFVELLNRMIPDPGDRWVFIYYLAAMVQHKGVKFQWAPFVQGPQGNGKTFLLDTMMEIMGREHSYKPRLGNLMTGGLKFNSWIENKTFIAMDEIYVRDNRELMDQLKEYITNRHVEIEAKGQPQRVVRNTANFIFVSNAKNGIAIEQGGRRYAPFFTKAVDPAFVGAVINWARAGGWSHVHYWLKNVAIPDAHNPAVGSTWAPQTSSWDEALAEARGPHAALAAEAVAEGRHGFRGGWISSAALSRLIKTETGKSPAVRTLGKVPAELGYVKVGRAVVTDDGLRSMLYARPEVAGSPEAMTDPGLAFLRSQEG